jgi:cathepsin B
VQIPVDVTLSASLPAPLQNVELKISGADLSAKKLLCMDIKTAPAGSVHPERAAQIAEIQNTPGVLWKAAAHPRFADKMPGASKDMNGVKGDQKKAVKDLMEKGEIVMDESANSNAAVPDDFDSETNWPQCAKIIGDIRDQSNCGCCWAFGGAEAASDRMCIATNATMMVPLSAQDVCFNGGGFMSMGCNGGQITSPWSYIKKGGLFGGKGAVSGGNYQGTGPFGKGLCVVFSLPHCHHHGPQGSDPYPAEGQPGCPSESSPAGPKKCDSEAQAPHNDFASDKYSYDGNTVTANGEAGIQKAIMAGGPMEVAFTVYSDFENYAGGIYHHVTGGEAGGHAVKVVGWGVESGTKYWKIANSWNPYWGEKGYFRIKRGNNEGGIEDQAIASSPTAKWSRAGAKTVVV